MKEIFAQVRHVRRGRHLFVRERLLGVQDDDGEGDSDNDKALDLQVVVQHGSCATEAQFEDLCKALDYLFLYGAKKLRVKCILYDMVGCGQSPVIPEWQAYAGDELQKDLSAIVEQHTNPSVPLMFVAHSYGPSILIHWLLSNSTTNNNTSNKIQQQNIAGFVFLGSSIRIDAFRPYPDGGPYIFRLPLFVLNYLQETMTREFVKKAVHPRNERVQKVCLQGSNANDMFMVQAFYRQSRWATAQELRQAVDHKPVLHIHGVSDEIIQISWGQHLVNQLSSEAGAEASTNDNHNNNRKNNSSNNVDFVPMEEASHLIMMEKPAEVARKMADFMFSLL